MEGLSEEGGGRKLNGRLVDVHRLLVSGSAVAKRNTVMISGESGWIIPNTGEIASGMEKALASLMKAHPKEVSNMTKVYEHKGIFCFDLWCRSDGQAGEDHQQLGAVGSGFKRQAQKP